MQTTIDLEPEVIRLAEEIAVRESVTIGKLLGDAFLEKFGPSENEFPRVVKGPLGLPEVCLGRRVTSEEIMAKTDQSLDEAVVPHHDAAPTFTIDEYGWPVVRGGRPITSEEVAALIEED